ncbi:MAG: NAD(P)-binding domain-containing protein [Bacteroidota bacterium]
MPEEFPMFPHHSHIIKYFDDYVDHFGIRDSITFNTSVEEVVIKDEGGYAIKLSNGDIVDYTDVIVANGHHWNPRMPEPPFPGEFTGEVLHSHYYKESDQVKDKDVLIIGIGNSAVDIACEAARLHSGKVVISTRSGAYITPNWIWSIPFDNLANPITAKLPLWLQRKLLATTLWLAHGNQEDYGVPKPDRPLLSEHPTLSQDLLNIAGRGLLSFKPNIKEFNGKTVCFDDGTDQDFDMIIYATGYRVSFPFLKHMSAFDVEQTNDIRLYKKVIHPDYKGLFFLGLVQPLGAIMPLAEVQSQWIAKLITGECKLPSKEGMKKSIQEDVNQMAKRYKKSVRHTLQVDFHPYKGTIEKEMKKMKV